MSTSAFNWRFIEQKAVLPGFGLSLGVSVLYISLVILLPLSALLMYVSDMSLAEYWAAISHPRVIASYKTTVGAALISTLFISLIGLLLAWVLSRYEFVGRRIVDGLIDLPFALPTAVAGLILATLFAPNGWLGHYFDALGIKIAFAWPGIVLAMSFTSLPFIVRSVQPLIENIDNSLDEAAETLGAQPWQRFYYVILPLLLPGLVTGASQAFIRCLGEFGAVIFIAGNTPYQTEVSSLMIFVRLAEYDYASAAAIASVVLATSLLLLFGLQIVQNRLFDKKH
ncbi:sulfate ABC transporter permease subunit CysT [Paenalcaligenes faecalis]|uniref:sulfate ABC transporter permease subunit CysT n=1 Tax=Paenalcaligenes faecalis TaxID=2980099 RepID=UPI0022B9BEC2|nr:sulfate ABC transporter permease subunit CysT [Paenalcaligenes faecalis]